MHLPSPHVEQTMTSDDDLALLPQRQQRSDGQSISTIRMAIHALK